jgi:hypothetical protein
MPNGRRAMDTTILQHGNGSVQWFYAGTLSASGLRGVANPRGMLIISCHALVAGQTPCRTSEVCVLITILKLLPTNAGEMREASGSGDERARGKRNDFNG